ncbi:MAG: alpha-ketoacid dehydrogenase subunit beta [Oscillospiraceae bacterium]|nr:alpha-ketoacid dehydrogenase subunit beta [Oscillospiraceae bacterium]
MKTMNYRDAIREAMCIRMREDDSVLLMGEDVGFFGGSSGITAGMFEEFGEKRVRDTPISESAIIGAAVGSAATGLRPIIDLLFVDFMLVGIDQIVNQAAKMRYMFGGKISMPMVARLPCGGGAGLAAQHSQSLEAWLTHIPGLKTVYPSTPQDALGLMLSAIDDDNPVMFLEHRLLYDMVGEIVDMNPIPLGVGDIKRAGSDVTVVATGKMVHEALRAADILANDGIALEVIDPRSLYPFDMDMIAKSLEKTRRAVIITEENKRVAFSAEISATIAEEYFDLLDAPVVRIGALNTPAPFSPPMETYYLPCAEDIVAAVRKF